MKGLSDRVYKFVVVGRIVFIATILFTFILLTATVIKNQGSAQDASLKNIDAMLLANDKKSDVEVPTTGEDDTKAQDEQEVEEEESDSDSTPEEKTAEVVPQNNSASAATNNYRKTTPVNNAPVNNTPANNTPRPSTPDYNSITYVDDNGEALDNAVIPVVSNAPEEPATPSTPETPVKDDSSDGSNDF